MKYTHIYISIKLCHKYFLFRDKLLHYPEMALNQRKIYF